MDIFNIFFGKNPKEGAKLVTELKKKKKTGCWNFPILGSAVTAFHYLLNNPILLIGSALKVSLFSKWPNTKEVNFFRNEFWKNAKFSNSAMLSKLSPDFALKISWWGLKKRKQVNFRISVSLHIALLKPGLSKSTRLWFRIVQGSRIESHLSNVTLLIQLNYGKISSQESANIF